MMKDSAMDLRKRLIWLSLYAAAVCLGCFSAGGCSPTQKQRENLLVVNFHPDQVLRYQMTSTRRTTLAVQDSTTGKKQGSPQETLESMELVIAYKPVKIDMFGVTQIEGVCESIKVTRNSQSGKGQPAGDAVENLKGKPFILELSPSGKIEDFKQLEKILFDAGSTAFDTSRKEMRVKNPDMIYDFVALQWYLWDAIASVPNPMAGVTPGMTWKNTQLIAWPVPIPNPPCRITTFTLDSVKEENGPQKALIKSTYQLSDKTVAGFPRPYEGTFMMRGLFGFLQNYQFQSLAGQGEQIFNLTTGIVESDTQEYDLAATAGFLLPLGSSVPHLNIHQTLSVKLLDNR
jgi:hypothetical protein